MKRCVFVTGATGFVGTELVRQLAPRVAGLHALVRPESDLSRLANLGLTTHVGDIVDAPSVLRALERCAEDARARDLPLDVIHAAALISYKTTDRARQWKCNLEGTRNVLDACSALGVSRVLHVSSVVAVAAAAQEQQLDETAPYAEFDLCCDYMRSKRAAEELALASQAALDVVVVNPGAIFGADARGPNTLRFLRQLARGRLGPFAPPGALSVVGVEDVAAGCRLALERGRRGERYILVERTMEALDLFQLAAHLLGVRGPRRTAPQALWRALCATSALVDRVWPLQLMAPQALRMLGARWSLDAAKAREELGWRPAPFEAVLRQTIEALRSQRLL